MAHLYRVIFDTQRDRRYITWGIWVTANNQKQAKETAYNLWFSNSNPHYPLRNWRDNRPHMYHTTAQRMTAEEQDHPLQKFYKIADRYASWGYIAGR